VKSREKVLPSTATTNPAGHLVIGGCDTVDLAERFGTPLYVYDEETVRSRCREYVKAFSSRLKRTEVMYASKAFSTVAMCQLVTSEGLSIDVSTAGELHTAITAKVPGEKIYMHGNNKTRQELEMALDHGVRIVIVDNFDELTMIQEIAQARGITVPVYLRITPGIKAHTHEYLETGGDEAKFGFPLRGGTAEQAIGAALDLDNIELKGVHSHIGSQIYALHSFKRAVEVVFEFLAEIREKTGWVADEVDLGGGLGVKYVADDAPSSADELAEILLSSVESECEELSYPVPHILIEPGRSIAANAGVTLYTVGAIKRSPHTHTFVCVDGGMSDNLRPSMYGAVYEVLLANRPGEIAEHSVSIAGKHCETGDIVIKEAYLPEVVSGDILAIPATGAYGYSMANNYNRQPRPGAVLVANGHAREIVRRETLADIVSHDLSIE